MSSQKGDPIAYEVSDAIAVVTLARPPVNALDLAAVHALIAALNRAAADENVRAVVLASGVPKRFCAGLDIGGLIGKSTDEIRTLVHELYVGLYDAQAQLGKPSIAAVNGAVRCRARQRKRQLRLSGDRSRCASGDPFCPPAAHYRPPPRLRAALYRARLRRSGSGEARHHQSGRGGRHARKRGVQTRR